MSEPLLDADDIQANIAPGFRMPYQWILGLAAAPRELSLLVAHLLCEVTPMRQAWHWHRKRRSLYGRGYPSFERMRDTGTWVNICFTARALQQFGISEPARADVGFALGMGARSSLLGDPVDPRHAGHPSRWVIGGPGADIDVLVLLASAEQTSVAARVARLRAWCHHHGIDVRYDEAGVRLPGDSEHFGFNDGISQPAPRGRVEDQPDGWLSERAVVNSDAGPEWAQPSRQLIWTGQFIFGYPTQLPSDYRAPGPVDTRAELRNGSFLVFRRLGQNVAGFRRESARLAAELRKIAGLSSLSDERFRAWMVGRWPNGAPLVRAPRRPERMSEAERQWFQYKEAAPSLTLSGGQTVPGVAADPFGVRCPVAAHIRKVNPRDVGTDQGNEATTATLRILRRGIPFGPPYEQGPDCERGLLFLSYQTSIERQFELLVQRWMNSEVNPEDEVGHDLLVGQTPGRVRRARFPSEPFVTHSVTTSVDWVLPTGGDYFFCPSIRMLCSIAGRQSRTPR